MNSKFKVGDKVRFVSNDGPWVEYRVDHGDEGVVGGDGYFDGEISVNFGGYADVSPDDLELIEPCENKQKIKVGDKVRLSEDIPSLYTVEWIYEMFDLDLVVKRLEDGYAKVSFANPTEYGFSLDVIPIKYLVKVEDEKQNDMTNEKLKKAAKEWSESISAAIKGYGNAVSETYTNAVAEAYWDAYAAELAKEVAVKIVNKYTDVEQVAKDAVKLAKSVVENLKKK